MKKLMVLVAIVLWLGWPSPCGAQTAQNLEQENAQLRHRLERLENALEDLKNAPAAQKAAAGAAPANQDIEALRQQNAQLKQRLEKVEAALNAKSAKVTPVAAAPAAETKAAPPAPAPAPTAVKPVAPAAAEAKPATPAPAVPPAPVPPAPVVPAPAPVKKGVLSSLDIDLYGIIKGDASYDSSRVTPGNYVLYVDPQTHGQDNEFNMTANQTRLGLNIGGPKSETMEAAGKVEVDFYGNGLGENKAGVQLRHAYLTLLWPQSHVSLLAGQTSDVVSPLVPSTLNYTVLWDAGNIGYRRPQFRLTEDLPLGEKALLKFEEAITRSIGRTDLTGSESGEDAGFPTAQGRVSLKLPLLGPTPTTIGVSGHYGQEEYDLNTTGDRVLFDSWSANVDLTQPICTWLLLQGEFFTGSNLGVYLGGIGQGVNTTTREEIASTGGWAAATIGPFSQFTFNVGGGLDDPRDSEVPAGGRTFNTAAFGNVIYAWNKHTQVGLELSHWETQYKGGHAADDVRVQMSFLYSF